MNRLYQFAYSPFCAKVRKLLEYKGLEFETVEVDYLERAELLAASGQLYVPALTLDGETIVDSDRIARRLEELFPEPTIFPPGLRGLHEVLTHHIDNTVEDAVLRPAIADILEFQRARGPERAALWTLIRERRYGAGFVEKMVRERTAQLAPMRAALEPFEDALEGKGFILGRIGLADFALYGQLHFLCFTGENKIPAELKNLRAFFARMDRISARPEDAG